MGICFDTKLKGRTNNNLLPKIGELSIGISAIDSPTIESQKMTIGYENNGDIRNIGGSLMDSTLSSELGTENNLQGTQAIYLKNIASTLFVGNKYDLTAFEVVRASKGLTLDLSQFKYCTKLKSLLLGSSTVHNMADVSYLKNLLTLQFFGGGDTFDIASIKNLQLIDIGFGNNKNVTGDIANIPSSIRNLSIYGTDIYGNYEILLNYPTLQNISYIGLFMSNRVSGDLSKLPSDVSFIQAQNNPSIFGWKTERDSSSKIVAFEGAAKFGDDLDAMLVNQAKCQIGFISSDESYKKTISCSGNRTSTSDSAIQTLKNKGYAVYVNSVQM